MMRESGARENIWKMVAKIDKINWDTKDLDEPSDNVVACTEQMMKYRKGGDMRRKKCQKDYTFEKISYNHARITLELAFRNEDV